VLAAKSNSNSNKENKSRNKHDEGAKQLTVGTVYKEDVQAYEKMNKEFPRTTKASEISKAGGKKFDFS
jgi:hypothetical protein